MWSGWLKWSTFTPKRSFPEFLCLDWRFFWDEFYRSKLKLKSSHVYHFHLNSIFCISDSFFNFLHWNLGSVEPNKSDPLEMNWSSVMQIVSPPPSSVRLTAVAPRFGWFVDSLFGSAQLHKFSCHDPTKFLPCTASLRWKSTKQSGLWGQMTFLTD